MLNPEARRCNSAQLCLGRRLVLETGLHCCSPCDFRLAGIFRAHAPLAPRSPLSVPRQRLLYRQEQPTHILGGLSDNSPPFLFRLIRLERLRLLARLPLFARVILLLFLPRTAVGPLVAALFPAIILIPARRMNANQMYRIHQKVFTIKPKTYRAFIAAPTLCQIFLRRPPGFH